MATAKINILIIDNDQNLCAKMSDYLKSLGWSAVCINSPNQFEETLNQCNPDLIIMDKSIGLESQPSLIRTTRDSVTFQNIPILVTTDCPQSSTKVEALEKGADNVLIKPFGNNLLEAKIVALMRRATAYNQSPQNIIYENVSLDLRTHQAYVNDLPLKLTSTEFRIITELILKRGSIVHREQLALRSLTLRNHGTRTIDVHLTSLRKKLGPSVSNKIKTIRGIGYMLSA